MADSSVGMCLMKDSETLGVKLKSKNTEILDFKYVLMIMTITFKEKKIKKKKNDTEVGLQQKLQELCFLCLKSQNPYLKNSMETIKKEKKKLKIETLRWESA